MFFCQSLSILVKPVRNKSVLIPIYASRVSAGFPSPAEDFVDGVLDLNDLITSPSSTFIVNVTGVSMIDAGIDDGDRLIVDRSLKPSSGNIVVALIHGEMTVKRLKRYKGQWWLKPENPEYPTRPIPPGGEIWGVVVHTIKDHRNDGNGTAISNKYGVWGDS